jgi:hypothetical protein
MELLNSSITPSGVVFFLALHKYLMELFQSISSQIIQLGPVCKFVHMVTMLSLILLMPRSALAFVTAKWLEQLTILLKTKLVNAFLAAL